MSRPKPYGMGSKEKLWAQFDNVHSRIISRVDGAHGPSRYEEILHICESPIESLLAFELADLFCPCNPIDTLFWGEPGLEIQDVKVRFNTWFEESRCYHLYGPRPRLVIFPQVKIGSIRVDFMVMSDDDSEHECRSVVAIECDGHDFHERTKEQAARDRRRDRTLTAARMPIFRFTGSEIWRDSHACMREVEDFLWKEMFGRDCPLRRYEDDEEV